MLQNALPHPRLLADPFPEVLLRLFLVLIGLLLLVCQVLSVKGIIRVAGRV